jgi:small nuclear ribonucleoprotein E
MNHRGRKKKKTLTRPIVLAFKYMQRKTKIEIWLNEDLDTRIQGVIVGMDEFMNLTLDEAVELNSKQKTEKKLGRIVMKQDNICLMHSVDELNF